MGRSPTNTKSKLLLTAKDLIWQSSYGFVSVDDICNTAGIKKGSFYYYFSSKAALAVAVMEESYQEYEIEIRRLFSSNNSPVERFENLADFIYEKQQQAYDKYGRVCGCPFASLGSEMAGNEQLIQQKADEILHRQGNMFKETLKEMVDSGLLPVQTDISNTGSQIITTILGQVMVARIQNNLNNLKKDVKLSLFQTLGLEKNNSAMSTTLQEQHNGQ
ncbi:MAG: TetR/AcrR family transcriptional repressor of nem operon [Methylophagaceae bacterium]|jgi:TetR/AcrR family transcriptional repressor of nem operon